MNFIQKMKLNRKIRTLRKAQKILTELDIEISVMSRQIEEEFKAVQEAVKTYYPKIELNE